MVLLVGVAALTACSGGGGSSSPTTAEEPTATTVAETESTPPPTTAAPATTAEPTTSTIPPTTVPPPVVVPAGVQFEETGGALPVGFDLTSLVAMDTGAIASGYVRDGSKNHGAVALSPDGVTWEQIVLPDPTYAVPGYPIDPFGFTASNLVRGDAGFAMIANKKFNRTQGSGATTVDAIWHSVDGRTWTAVDLRPLLPPSTALKINGLRWVDGLYVALAGIAPLDLNGPSRGAVFTSPDGLNWTFAAELPGTWTLEATDVWAAEGGWVLRGHEYICTPEADSFSTFSTGAKAHLWQSTDAGTTWTEIEIPQSLLRPDATPPPTDPAMCPESLGPAVTQVYSDGFISGYTVGDQLVLWSEDRQHTALSDGAVGTWIEAPLPRDMDALFYGAPSMYSVEGAPALFAVEERDPALIGAVWIWDGAAWQEQPQGRPLIQTSGSFRSVPVRDEIWLIGGTSENDDVSELYVSRAGELKEFGTCDVGPGADCRFTDMSGLDLSGQDLTGIDLRGATLRTSNLSGANLTSALFDGIDATEVDLSGANLTGASMAEARFSLVDFTGADVTLANFGGSRVSLSLFDAVNLPAANLAEISTDYQTGDSLAGKVLAGLNLPGARFSVLFDEDTLDMTGVDLSGSNLNNASFQGVNLTGANFSGVTADFIIWGDAVTCPDGAPPTEGEYSINDCRVGVG